MKLPCGGSGGLFPKMFLAPFSGTGAVPGTVPKNYGFQEHSQERPLGTNIYCGP